MVTKFRIVIPVCLVVMTCLDYGDIHSQTVSNTVGQWQKAKSNASSLPGKTVPKVIRMKLSDRGRVLSPSVLESVGTRPDMPTLMRNLPSDGMSKIATSGTDIGITTSTNWSNDPILAANQGGTLFSSFVDTSSTTGRYYNIYRSTDYGSTWAFRISEGYANSSAFTVSSGALTAYGSQLSPWAYAVVNGFSLSGATHVLYGFTDTSFSGATFIDNGLKPALTNDYVYWPSSTSIYLVYYSTNRDSLVFRRSDDNGVTWNPSIRRLSGAEVTSANLPLAKASCSIAFSEYNGIDYVHVVYAGYNTSSGTVDLYYVQSTDYGNTWTAPSNFSTTSSGIGNDDLVPSVDAQGSFVVFTFEPKTTGGQTGIAYFYSRDAGTSWAFGLLNATNSGVNGVSPAVSIEPNANGAYFYIGYTRGLDANTVLNKISTADTTTTSLGVYNDASGVSLTSRLGLVTSVQSDASFGASLSWARVYSATDYDIYFDATRRSTPGGNPTATTNAATGISGSAATLNGSAYANGLSTKVTFQYGPSNYNSTITAAQSPISGTSTVGVSAALSGLPGGTTYTYRAIASNSNGTYYGSQQSFVSAGSLSAPSAPSGLVATTVSSSQINLSWTASTSGNPTVYRIFRSLTSGSGFTKIDSVSGSLTAYGNVGLSPSTTYYYLVYAVNAAGQSASSNQANATTLSGTVTVPSAPTGLIATAISSSQINLSWTASTSGSPTVYRIFRSLTSGAGFSKIDSVNGTITTYANTGLSSSTTYYYLVYAVNAGGQSAASNQASASTPAVTTSITVTTPAVNWATLHTYTIQWTSQNLTGSVNIKLSLDNGVTFPTTIVASTSNSGSYSWTISSSQTLSNLCMLRVESSTNTSIFGLSKAFAIVNGSSVSSTQTTTVSATFSSNPKSSTEYRLISFPGSINSVTVSQLGLSGTPNQDWKMFREPGTSSAGFTAMGTTNTLKTGEGYWFIQKNSLSKGFTFATPTLNSDATVTITLTGGVYSIIGNPFSTAVPWSAVLSLNGLASNTPLYSWNGSWSSSSTSLQPGVGYYINSTGLTTLKIPYAAFGFPSQVAGDTLQAVWRLQLAYESEMNVDDDNYIGIAKGTSVGKDKFEFNKPPLIFDESFVYMERPDWDSQNDKFYADYRPEVGAGQTWDFEITNPTKTLGTLSVRGIEQIDDMYNVYLVNEETGVTVDLREKNSMQYGYGRTTGHFKVIVGPESYVSEQLQAYVPKEFGLLQNYPNPFNPSTTVTFKLPERSPVRLEVFSLLGQRIKVLSEGQYEAGVHQVVWMGDNDWGARVASGVYFCRLVSGKSAVQTVKMLLTK